MSQFGGVRESAARLFFFYLPAGGNARMLEKYCAQKPEHRRDALVEIIDTTLLATNDICDDRYPYAFVSLMHRMARQNYPSLLLEQEGLERYGDYLIRSVGPSAEELRQAYRYTMNEAWQQARRDPRKVFK